MSVVPPRLAWFPLSRFFWLSGFWFPGFLDFVYWFSGPGFWFLVSWLPVFLVSGVVCRFPGCWVSWLLGYWFSDLLVSWGPGFVVFPFARSKEAWARGPRGPGNLGLLGLYTGPRQLCKTGFLRDPEPINPASKAVGNPGPAQWEGIPGNLPSEGH